MLLILSPIFSAMLLHQRPFVPMLPDVSNIIADPLNLSFQANQSPAKPGLGLDLLA
jgi:hypothetical protein